MSELRRDPLQQRWVIVAPERARRPVKSRAGYLEPLDPGEPCAFCPRKEELTRPEVYRWPSSGEWRVRVFPNYFPMLRVEGAVQRAAESSGERVEGVGAHEVVVETSEHGRELGDLDVAQIAEVLGAYQRRLQDLYRDVRLRQLVVFKNRGVEAGASMAHAHSQLVALPVLPEQARRHLTASREHHRATERCLLMDLVQQELRSGERIVRDQDGFVTFAPYASLFRYELMITPRDHAPFLGDLDAAGRTAAAGALKDALRRIQVGLGDPAYNVLVYPEPNVNAEPRRGGTWDTLRLDFQWHLRVIPRLGPLAGLEAGADVFVNSTPPEEAALHLRGVAVD